MNTFSIERVMRIYMTIRIASMVLLALMLSGCFGGVATYPVECEFDYPIKNYTYTKKDWAPCNGAEVINFSKADFLSDWGAPDEVVQISANREMWIYKHGEEYCGVVLAVGVPIPLIFPSCKVFDHITFENDLAIHVHLRRMKEAGAVMGFPRTGTCNTEGLATCPDEKAKAK